MTPKEETPESTPDPVNRLQEFGMHLTMLVEKRAEDAVNQVKKALDEMLNLVRPAEECENYDGSLHRAAIEELQDAIAILRMNDGEYDDKESADLEVMLLDAHKQIEWLIEMKMAIIKKINTLRKKKKRDCSYIMRKCALSSPDDDPLYYKNAVRAFIVINDTDANTYDDPFNAIQARIELEGMFASRRAWKSIFETPQGLARALFDEGHFSVQEMNMLMDGWQQHVH